MQDMEDGRQYCLKWNNHPTNISSVFDRLRMEELFVDVTLATSDRQIIRAHRVLLSAGSGYLEKVLAMNPSDHPTVVLSNIRYKELKLLVDFMYSGEIAVDQQQFPLLLEAAKSLKIKGLYEESDDATEEERREQLDTISVTAAAEHIVSSNVKAESFSPAPRKRSQSEESEEEPIRSPPSLHTDTEAQPESEDHQSPSKMFKYNSSPMQGVSNPFWMISQGDKKIESPQEAGADVPSLMNIVNQTNLDSKSLPSAQKLNEQFLQAMHMCTNPYLAAMQKPLDLLSPNFNSSFQSASPTPKMSPNSKSGLISSAPVRRYKQYSEDSLQAALKEIMNGQSINRSSMKHNIPARTLRDWMKRLNIKSVFTHHSHNKERSNSHDGSTDRESSSSLSPEPITSPGFSATGLFTSPQNDSVFPGMKINVKEDEIDDDEPRTLRIDESPLNNITQIAQEAN